MSATSLALNGEALSTAMLPMAITFSPGAVGGVCNVLCGHPIDLVKVRLQVMTCGKNQTTGTFGMLQNIVKTSGISGLYVGVSAPLVAVVPAFAVSFGSYEYAKNYLQMKYRYSNDSNKQNSLSQTTQVALFAGAFSGLSLAAVLGPLERIKVLMQVSTTKLTFQQTIVQCYADGGIRSLFRGTALTMCRDVPGNAMYFGTYEGIRQCLKSSETGHVSIPATLFAGGMAGVMNWIVAIPLDVVKSRWQTNGSYRNVYQDVIVHLLRTEGPTGFFKGLGPALIRAFPANAACLLGVEMTRNLLSYWHCLDDDR